MCDKSQIFAAHASAHNCLLLIAHKLWLLPGRVIAHKYFQLHASAHNCFAAERSQVMVVTWACDSSQIFAVHASAYSCFDAAERSQAMVVRLVTSTWACDSSQKFAAHARALTTVLLLSTHKLWLLPGRVIAHICLQTMRALTTLLLLLNAHK